MPRATEPRLRTGALGLQTSFCPLLRAACACPLLLGGKRSAQGFDGRDEFSNGLTEEREPCGGWREVIEDQHSSEGL